MPGLQRPFGRAVWAVALPVALTAASIGLVAAGCPSTSRPSSTYPPSEGETSGWSSRPPSSGGGTSPPPPGVPAEAPPPATETGAVGAIFPLSGRGREVGQSALQGLMLAASGSEVRGGLRVVFRDDASDPERAVEALEELASHEHVMAVVGPVEGASAARLAVRAQELGIPLIVLAPAERVAEAGPMIFRLFLTPQGEARELVEAARARGARRFAVLRPDNAYGRAMGDAFVQQVRALGAEHAATVTYAPTATSFAAEVAELRRATFDALFVPDAARRLALIAPALAAGDLWSSIPGTTAPRNARAITLLAPSVGYDPDLVRTTSRYLQGALFSLPFHPAASGPDARDFIDRYEAQYGAAPTSYAAYAYDAFSLVERAMAEGVATRTELAEALRRLGNVDTVGASGGFDAARGPLRATRIFDLRGMSLQPIESAPSQPSST